MSVNPDLSGLRQCGGFLWCVNLPPSEGTWLKKPNYSTSSAAKITALSSEMLLQIIYISAGFGTI